VRAETHWRKNIGTRFAERLGRHFDSLFVGGMDTIEGCKYAALELFIEIDRQHGRAWARRIFAMWGTPPTKTRINQIRDYAVLDEYDMMRPKPNANKLARIIVERNRTAPKEERWGGTDEMVVRRRIARLIADRRSKMKAGKWWGPQPV
jgi:hypothetical protein